MGIGLIGKKCGMTRIFKEDGSSIPVSVVEIVTNQVSQIKTTEGDGYSAIQISYGNKARNLNKSTVGHLKIAGIDASEGFYEFRVSDDEITKYSLGMNISADQVVSAGNYVDITGCNIGKGFAGTVKRHNFSMQDATHGNSLSHRAPGSIGQRQTPGRVFKGKRMSGHMGNVTTTVQNLEVVKIDMEKSVILVKGAIPGSKGGKIIIKNAFKSRKK